MTTDLKDTVVMIKARIIMGCPSVTITVPKSCKDSLNVHIDHLMGESEYFRILPGTSQMFVMKGEPVERREGKRT